MYFLQRIYFQQLNTFNNDWSFRYICVEEFVIAQMTSFITFVDIFTMQRMHEISIKLVVKNTLSKMYYLHLRRIKCKVAEMTVHHTLLWKLFSGEKYACGAHLTNTSYFLRPIINKVIKQNKNHKYDQLCLSSCIMKTFL